LSNKGSSLPNSGKGFRKWLVERVSTTSHAQSSDDDDVDKMAERMGVHPDVLLEARIMARQRRIDAGRAVGAGVKRAGSNHYQFELLFPPEVFDAWKQECANRGMTGSVMMRSLIHAYLLGSVEPDAVSKRWEYRGIVHPLPNVHQWAKDHGRRYPYRERSLIPQGARRALVHRSSRLGMDPTTVVRSLILLMMNGRWAHPGTIRVIDCANMYDDETRYHLG
jgi:hypothetical protein